VRRAEPDCSNEAERNTELQQAIATMIIGNDDKSYLSHSIQHKHRSKLNHADMCEEDNGPDEIAPDTTIRERALCSFIYVENFNKTVSIIYEFKQYDIKFSETASDNSGSAMHL
jgi:hypothetical protein